MRRTRSYADLSPDERTRYDRLRSLVARLSKDPGGVRAKRCGSRSKRRRRLKEAADAMLGLTREPDLRVDADLSERTRPWTGSTTIFGPQGRLPR